MDTQNSNDNGLPSDFEGEKLPTQAGGTENSPREGDFAHDGLCPQCFHPVETERKELCHDLRGNTIVELVDICPICGWFGLVYFED